MTWTGDRLPGTDSELLTIQPVKFTSGFVCDCNSLFEVDRGMLHVIKRLLLLIKKHE